MKRLAWLGVLLSFGLWPLARAGSGGTILPSDLVHVKHPGCNLRQYAKEEVLNAKTGKVDRLMYWSVQPYAEYDDGRPRREYATKTGSPEFIADEADKYKAFDACQARMDSVNHGMLEEFL